MSRHAGRSQRRRRLPRIRPAVRLGHRETHENTNGIGPATNARDDGVRQPTGLTLDLHTCLHADDSLEIAHHGWKRMRSGRSTKAVVGVVGVGNPIPERLIDGVFERFRARLNRDDFGTQQSHPGHV